LGRDEPSAVDAIHVARRIVPRGAPAGVLVEDVVAVPTERPWSRFNASLASSSRWYQGCLASAAASRANDRRDRRRRRRSRRKGWVIQPRYRHREATTVTRVGRAPLSGRRGAAFARDVAFELCAPLSKPRTGDRVGKGECDGSIEKSPGWGCGATATVPSCFCCSPGRRGEQDQSCSAVHQHLCRNVLFDRWNRVSSEETPSCCPSIFESEGIHHHELHAVRASCRSILVLASAEHVFPAQSKFFS
jgi:hypothetical protein